MVQGVRCEQSKGFGNFLLLSADHVLGPVLVRDHGGAALMGLKPTSCREVGGAKKTNRGV